MLNKPITLSIILILVYFGTALCFSSIDNSFLAFLLILIVLFLCSVYMGYSYVKAFKTEQSRLDKIKISAYFAVFWIVFCLTIVTMLIMNTTVKDAPLFHFNLKQTLILVKMVLLTFSQFFVNGLSIYFGLNVGNKLGLRLIRS